MGTKARPKPYPWLTSCTMSSTALGVSHTPTRQNSGSSTTAAAWSPPAKLQAVHSCNCLHCCKNWPAGHASGCLRGLPRDLGVTGSAAGDLAASACLLLVALGVLTFLGVTVVGSAAAAASLGPCTCHITTTAAAGGQTSTTARNSLAGQLSRASGIVMN